MDKATHNPWQIVQTIVLAATAAGIFLNIGRRDRDIAHNAGQISELRSISTDLVKSQVLAEANDATHSKVLDELKERISILEQR